MKSKDLLLITTGMASTDVKHPGFISRLRTAIATARRFGLNPILVLGPEGDDVLLSLGGDFESCDFIFDPNYSGRLFSSIKAGLMSTSGAAFVWHMSHDGADESVWLALDRAMWSMKPGETVDVLRYERTPGQPAPTFPQLITLQGARRLRDLPADTEWDGDTRILTSKIRP